MTYLGSPPFLSSLVASSSSELHISLKTPLAHNPSLEEGRA